MTMKNLIFIFILNLFLGAPVLLAGNNDANNQPTPGSITVGSGTQPSSLEPFFADLRRAQNQMERVFRNLAGDQLATFPQPSGTVGTFTYSPDLDMRETKDEYQISLDLPGMKKEEIEIEVKNRILTISGERKREETRGQKDAEGEYYFEGRSFGSFDHTMELPENADEDAIDASYENGVLELTIKKKELSKIAEKGKKIAIS